ncbi:hypothetical protein NDU88_004655 [Pleurodeles waltl]|uniref:Uncharacterized protein n=1 Tax=Pleurodeles waltl TaxID=8319 RepID=A0AAV7PFM4_PLEWA|nr:hypothetical protein NDU88_004655 [Pleurodeles waltl]
MYGCQSTDEYYNTACKPTCLQAQEVCLRLLGNRTRLVIRERKGNWTRAGARLSRLPRYHSCKQDAYWSVSFLVAGIPYVRRGLFEVAWQPYAFGNPRAERKLDTRRSASFLVAEVPLVQTGRLLERVVPGCRDTALAK